MFPEKLNQSVNQRKAEGNYRTLQSALSGIDFYSNDYLGLSQNQDLHQLLSSVKDEAGSTGSRLMSGNTERMEIVENQLANYYNTESSLMYSSGYMANLGLLSCIGTKDDTIIYDQYIHASSREGIRLSPARNFSFKHNDYGDLEKKLQNASGDIYVAIEAIYSMNGDIPDHTAILELQEKYGFYLIVDEAHSSGILGKSGKGWCADYPDDLIFAKIITFGKAFGYHGAIVAGNKELKEYLINFSKPFIYTTSMPQSAFEKIYLIHEYYAQNQGSLTTNLYNNISYYNNSTGDKYISPIKILKNKDIEKIERELKNTDIQTKIICYPTVPKGEEILRICLHNFNTKDEMNQLLKIILND